MKMLWVALYLALTGCATASTASAAASCGDPCASKSCPSAFVCIVGSNCAARCEAEPIKPGNF